MIGKLPAAGIIIALAVVLVLAFTGTSPWLALIAGIMWIASLWIARPPATLESAVRVERGAEISAIAAYLEPISQPLLLIDNNRLMATNAAAREALGAHLLGQDARVALRHPQAVALLQAGAPSTVDISGFSGPRSLWQLSRWELANGIAIVECVDRTSEADISRAHTDFVANASHELRTPLASILGYLETLSDAKEPLDAATQARFLGTMTSEAKRMQALIEDLMSLSRIEAEKNSAPADQIDLCAVASAVAADIATVRGQASISFECTAHPALTTGDGRQIDQLIRNLIDNALKYGDGSHPVQLTIAPHNSALRLAVCDFGPGIAAEHLPHLTRRFYRTDPGRSQSAGGTGLGLAIVKHIAERHRAPLAITSEPGSGTTVTVDFPQMNH